MKHHGDAFLQKLPKAELHVHIEGTLEPEQLFVFAERNKIDLNEKELLSDDKKSYRFSDFSSFIKTYLNMTHVLCTEQDFYELTRAYLDKAHEQGVRHAEMFVDLQSYLARDISPHVVLYGIHAALQERATLYGMSGSLIVCFLRHLSEGQAMQVLTLIEHQYKQLVPTIGLAALEEGNPVSKFAALFAQAHAWGFHCVAHIAELGGPELIWSVLDRIPIERIDHGIGSAQDPKLMAELARRNMPLTVCPISNVMLGACRSLREHPIRVMYDAGIRVTINSDDPAFFKGYIADNYRALLHNDVLSCSELIVCARNSIDASFVDAQRRQELLDELDAYVKKHNC